MDAHPNFLLIFSCSDQLLSDLGRRERRNKEEVERRQGRSRWTRERDEKIRRFLFLPS